MESQAPSKILSPVERLEVASLAEAHPGFRGVISQVRAVGQGAGPSELERRLLELGFVEGARVEVLHEGFIGKDPICVRLDDMRVALRRREARGVMVRETAPP